MAAEQPPAASWGADTDGRLNQPSEHLTKYAMWQTDASGNVTGLVGPDGSINPMARKNTAVAIGDSVLSLGSSGSSSTAYHNQRNWLAKAIAASGDQIRVKAWKGTSGNKLADMLARFESDVLSYTPGIVIVQGCSNDFDAGVSANTAFGNLLSMYQLTRSIGAKFLYVGTAGMLRSAAAESPFTRMRHMAAEAAACLPGFWYCDMAQAMQKFTGKANNGDTLISPAVASADGTHPSSFGATLMAAPLSALLTYLAESSVWHRRSLNNISGAYYDTSSFGYNSLMAAGSGGTVGAGCSGSAPEIMEVSRSGSITSASSVIARTDGYPGQWWRHEISGAAATTDYVKAGVSWAAPNANATLAAALVGYQGRGLVEINASVSSGYIHGIKLIVKIKNAGGSTLFTAGYDVYTGPELDWITSFSGILSTPEFTIPANAANAEMYVYINTSAGATAVVDLCGLDVLVDTFSPQF